MISRDFFTVSVTLSFEKQTFQRIFLITLLNKIPFIILWLCQSIENYYKFVALLCENFSINTPQNLSSFSFHYKSLNWIKYKISLYDVIGIFCFIWNLTLTKIWRKEKLNYKEKQSSKLKPIIFHFFPLLCIKSFSDFVEKLSWFNNPILIYKKFASLFQFGSS